MHFYKQVFLSKVTPDFSFIPISTSNTSDEDHQHYAQLLAGKLLLREEIDLPDHELQLLLTQKNLQEIKSIVSYFKGKKHHCRRCGNRSQHLFASLPCARCNSTHIYCRHCIEMGRVMACASLYFWTGQPPVYKNQSNPCAWEGELTPTQAKAATEIEEVITKQKQELLVWAVCGAGKTEMLFPGISTAIKQGKRICLATPRADVVRELLPRFQQSFPDTTIAALYGGVEDKQAHAQFIIATTHQLLRYAHAFDVVIIDEVDAFPFHADPALPYVAKRSAKPNASTIYLTATPRKALKRRSQQRKLPTVFVPVRFHGQPLPVPKMQNTLAMQKALQKAELPNAFWSWFNHRINPTRQVLLFVPTIKLAKQLITPLQKRLPNKKITAVHAADKDREEKVQHFREKGYDILVTTTILERGVTFPSVDVAVLDAGHAVFDQAALVQIAGRAGRSPADPTGEVIFFHDGKTNAMMEAGQVIYQMNQKARKG